MAQLQHGGARPHFARYVSDATVDVDAVLQEAAAALDVARFRLRLLRSDCDGHELVARRPECRCYHQGEVSMTELRKGPPRAA